MEPYISVWHRYPGEAMPFQTLHTYQKIDLKSVMLISIGVVGMGNWEVILGDGSKIFNL